MLQLKNLAWALALLLRDSNTPSHKPSLISFLDPVVAFGDPFQMGHFCWRVAFYVVESFAYELIGV